MSRFPGLDLLRAIAILWVMLFHGWAYGLGSPAPALAKFGWIGVDLFFVLSGYLIGAQLFKACAGGEMPALGRFYRRRAFRILPAYLVVVGFYFLTPSLRETPAIQPCWQFLTFTENLLIDFSRDKAFSHVWSLCVEEHFYLVFPLLVWGLLRRPSWQKSVAVGMGLFGAGLFLRGYVWLHVVNPGHPLVGGVSNHTGLYIQEIYYPTYMRLDGLLVGVALAALRCFRTHWWQTWTQRGYLLLGLGAGTFAAAIWLLQVRFDFWPTVLGFPLLSLALGLIMTAFVSPQVWFSHGRVPGAQAVASIAFSLYLSHKVAWRIVSLYWPRLVAGHGLQSFLVCALAALAVGALLYWAVERPFLVLRDRMEKCPA